MKRIGLAVVLVALFCTISLHLAAQALPDSSGQNINIVTGSADQFIGDMFRQRQNEPVFGVSSVNPSHMMAAYNDYRTVDVADDQSVGTPSPVQTLLARVVDFFIAPWRRGGERRRDADELEAAAQAWIGLSFSDNGGKSWYTGLHPGFFANQTNDDVSSPLYGYQAASDPVLASTDHQFFVGGIAFTPNATSVGFVSRFTDFNDTATGQNIRFDRTTALISQPTGYFVDKPSVAAGPNGHVYAAFVVFDNSDPKKLSSTIRFFRSSNFGDTWSAGAVISDPRTRNQSPWIVVDPNNENVVYIGWRVFSNNAGGPSNLIVGRRSSDGGATFVPSTPYTVAAQLKAFDAPQTTLNLTSVPTVLPNPRSNAYPTAAIDGNGAIHLALQEYVNPTTGLPLGPSASVTTGVPRITVTSSYDRGASWTPRKAIDFGSGSGSQFMPVITAVGEQGPSCAGSNGPRSRVMLMYYDARAAGVGVATGTAGYLNGGGKQFDVRIAQASACIRDSANRLIFGTSDQLSRYSRNAAPPQNIVTTPGYGYTAVNRAYEMFCGGRCAFTGDYIHLVPRVPYVFTPSGWKPTTAGAVDRTKLPAPVVQGVWADTRDVILPRDPAPLLQPGDPLFIDTLGWWNYQPPGSGRLSCINPGARDQNVYMAEYAPTGVFAAAPETFLVSNIPHSYPVYIENRSKEQRFFHVTIDPAAFAAFNYTAFTGDNPAAPDKDADIAIGGYSTVTGSVVIGPGQNVPVALSIVQITNTGAIVPNGASTAVTLYTAGAAAPTTSEVHAPVVTSTPVVTHPFAGTNTLPFRVTAGTPFTQNPFTQNPFSQNPFSQNPFSQNPFTQNPFTQNQAAQDSADGTVYDVTDVSFAVTNGGNETAAFTTLLQIENSFRLQGSYLFQVFINRISSTPALNGCAAVDQSQTLQVSSLITPFTQNPFSQNPFSQNPFTQNPFTQNPFSQNPFSQNTDPRDPVVSNSSFYLAPPATTTQTARADVNGGRQPQVRLASAVLDGSGHLRSIAFQPSAPTTTSNRANRPNDLVLYTLRAYQILPSDSPAFVPLIPAGGTPPVGISVVAETPDVVTLPGGVIGFDPQGPQVSSGGNAVPVGLAFVSQPATTAPGAPIVPPVQVAIQDGFGNTLTNSTMAITLRLGANPGNAALTGTLTQAAVNGVATFSNLSINRAASGYTLLASAAGVTGATSIPFDIAACTTEPPNLTNWWSASGDTADIRSGANGTIQGNVAFTNGKVGQAFSFSGTAGGRILVANNEQLRSLGDQVTIAAWVRPSAFPNSDPAIVSKLGQWVMSATAAGAVSCAIGGQTGFLSGGALPLNQWSHVACTFNSSSGQHLYINGSEVASRVSSPGPVFDDGRVLTIGNQEVDGREFAGLIDEVQLFHRDLDASEVQAIYNASGAGICAPSMLVVTNANDSGAGSLRQAILDANANPDFSRIAFNIPSTSSKTITPATALPTITSPVLLDGTTQPGFAGAPIIEIDGTGTSNSSGVDGLWITAGGSIIQGFVVNRFTGNGLRLETNGFNTIRTNYIGTNAAGTAAAPNAGNGIHVIDSAANTIGERNLVSGNGAEGIRIDGAPSTHNLITSNYIGTSATGTAAVGNTNSGIYIRRAPANVIRSNVVSGNTGFAGIAICGDLSFCGGDDFGTQSSDAAGTVVQFNNVGTTPDGQASIPNGNYGVSIDGAPDTLVGDPTGILANRIANSGLAGIVVFHNGAVRNRLIGNNIYSNTGLGIDLGTGNGADGITPNDPGDADTGPNDLLNFPVLTGATTTQVTGTFNSTPNAPFAIQLYANGVCHPSGNGEGQVLLTSFSIVTDANGNASFSQPITGVSDGTAITGTAIDAAGNTSEFSACTTVGIVIP